MGGSKDPPEMVEPGSIRDGGGSGGRDMFHGFWRTSCPPTMSAPAHFPFFGDHGAVPVPELPGAGGRKHAEGYSLGTPAAPRTGDWLDAACSGDASLGGEARRLVGDGCRLAALRSPDPAVVGSQRGGCELQFRSPSPSCSTPVAASGGTFRSPSSQFTGTLGHGGRMFDSSFLNGSAVPLNQYWRGKAQSTSPLRLVNDQTVDPRKEVLVGSSSKWNKRLEVMQSESSHSSAGSAGFIRAPRTRAVPIQFAGSRKGTSKQRRPALVIRESTTQNVSAEGICTRSNVEFDLNSAPAEGVGESGTAFSIGTMGVPEECIAGTRIDLMEFVEASANETSIWSDDSDGETEVPGQEQRSNVRTFDNESIDLNNPQPRRNGCPAVVNLDANVDDQEGQASSSGSSHGVEGGPEVSGPKQKRVYYPDGPPQRDPVPGRKSALEQALMKFADRNSDYIINPAIGTEFDSMQEAYEYYNLYSWECGFGIRCGKKTTSSSQKFRDIDPKERYVRALELLCCCAGKPDNNTSVSSRTGCGAMIRLHRTEDHGWVVVEHRDKHNHQLSESCGEKRQWPSHKHIDKYTRDLIRILRENNIGVTKIYSILGSFFGSMHNVPTTKRTLRNVCQTINREQAEDDIRKTLEVFREFREADPGFQYAVEPDDEGRIKSLMWTNARSRMQYAHFGDVVTFDTTYRTNLYDMPFGMFVGVNNHFQSVLFGCVLLTEETIPSFKWVFEEFVSLMGGKRPKTILTDQCRAMEVAISEVWPGVEHRWCKWHVLRRVRECVGTKYTGNKEFRDKFHKMLNEMLTIEEFESAWKSLLAEYGLLDNPFLDQVYEVRRKWAKPFFKGVFCAKQTSTQRSESANHMVKGLVPPGCPIHHFVRQYAKLQHTIDDNENYEERRTKLFTRDLSMGGPLVHQASKVYTFKVFGMFCKLKMESEFYFVREVSHGTKYLAVHYNLDKVQRWCKGEYLVEVDEERSMFSCECGLFQHFGLPCSHSLRVMISLGLRSIPEAMIMLRWTKKARLVLPAHLAQYGEPNPTLLAQTYRHSALFIAALELVQLGDSNVECFHIAMSCILEAKLKLVECSKEKDGMGLSERQAAEHASVGGQNVAPLFTAGQDEGDQFGNDLFPLRVPNRKRKAGRPSNAREKPGYEQLSKRTRRCKTCRASDHRSDRCPNRDPASSTKRGPPRCSGCGLSGHSVVQCGKQLQGAVAVACVGFGCCVYQNCGNACNGCHEPDC